MLEGYVATLLNVTLDSAMRMASVRGSKKMKHALINLNVTLAWHVQLENNFLTRLFAREQGKKEGVAPKMKTVILILAAITSLQKMLPKVGRPV